MRYEPDRGERGADTVRLENGAARPFRPISDRSNAYAISAVARSVGLLCDQREKFAPACR
jgi:hypothetical protein